MDISLIRKVGLVGIFQSVTQPNLTRHGNMRWLKLKMATVRRRGTRRPGRFSQDRAAVIFVNYKRLREFCSIFKFFVMSICNSKPARRALRRVQPNVGSIYRIQVDNKATPTAFLPGLFVGSFFLLDFYSTIQNLWSLLLMSDADLIHCLRSLFFKMFSFIWTFVAISKPPLTLSWAIDILIQCVIRVHFDFSHGI